MMNSIRHVVDTLIEYVLIFLMGLSVLNVLWQVITRFLLNNPSSYTEEIARFLLIWIGLIGAAYGIGRKIHLAIDVLRQKLPKDKKRIVNFLIHGIVLLFAFTVMIIGGIYLVILTFELRQISAALQLKLGYVYLAVPLSGILMAFYSLVNLSSLIRNGKEA
jgi:TRAP-type C4-dicarboxylate transport system permease small subunit